MNTDTPHHSEEAAFLRTEAAKIRRQARVTWIVGTLMIAAIGAYFSFIHYMIRTVAEPQTLANFAAATIEEATPPLIAEVEATLKAEAPEVANHLSQTFLTTLPELRRGAEAQIRLCHEEMIPHVSRELQGMIQAYVSENGDELRAFVRAHDDAAFAQHFTEAVFEELGHQINQTFQIEGEGADVVYFKDNLMIALLAMESHLDALGGDPAKLDERQRKQRRALAALANKLADPEVFNAMPQDPLPTIPEDALPLAQ